MRFILPAILMISACKQTPSVEKHRTEPRVLELGDPAPVITATPSVVIPAPTPIPSTTPIVDISPVFVRDYPLDKLLKPVIPFELVAQPVYLSFRASAPVTPNIGGSGGAALMDLMLANRFQEIQPDLKDLGVKTIYTMGIYNHRTIAGTARISRHSYATAIDFSGFEFRDGRRAMIDEVYATGGSLVLRARLEKIRAFLKTKFDVVLGPGDRNHDDHFHVDLNPANRPSEYPLSSGFIELVARVGWVPIENFFYAGTPPWFEAPAASRAPSPDGIGIQEDSRMNMNNCED